MATANVGKTRGLADAAGYLCSAHDELAAAGYERWRDELRDLIEIISNEIGWLEGSAHEGESASAH
ncbi:MAG TPA: hypothetical protein VGL09_10860 [Methylomirabilota bacterium]|jgi:hypothetical protein